MGVLSRCSGLRLVNARWERKDFEANMARLMGERKEEEQEEEGEEKTSVGGWSRYAATRPRLKVLYEGWDNGALKVLVP